MSAITSSMKASVISGAWSDTGLSFDAAAGEAAHVEPLEEQKGDHDRENGEEDRGLLYADARLVGVSAAQQRDSDIAHAAERLKPFIRNVKRQDAQALLKVLLEGKHSDEARKSAEPLTGWLFNETTQWQKLRAQH